MRSDINYTNPTASMLAGYEGTMREYSDNYLDSEISALKMYKRE